MEVRYMGKRFLWTEEKILNWINTNDLNGFKFIKITKTISKYLPKTESHH